MHQQGCAWKSGYHGFSSLELQGSSKDYGVAHCSKCLVQPINEQYVEHACSLDDVYTVDRAAYIITCRSKQAARINGGEDVSRQAGLQVHTHMA